MTCILVCPTAHADDIVRAHAPSHVLGFAAPDDPWHGPVRQGRLVLRFNDIASPRPGFVAPSGADIDAILALGAAWDGVRPFLVHCRMGISRSPAAAFILACARRPAGTEAALARRLRSASPCATPNALMVALADDRLGRAGRMADAVRSIGRGEDYRPYRSFALR